jgi:SAM-dependent methyltransferase
VTDERTWDYPRDSGRTTDFFDAAYREAPPWDVGEPQQALVALLDEYPPTGPVLDVGCGTDDLALALARRGPTVFGVDLAPAAISRARAKAAEAEPEVGRRVEFRVGDALHPASFSGPFGAVVDSGFFHLFGPLERKRFVRELADALAVGGRYYLLGFAIDSLMPNAPRPVREEELRALFAPEYGWRVLALRPARFRVRSERGAVPATGACFERMPLKAEPGEGRSPVPVNDERSCRMCPETMPWCCS